MLINAVVALTALLSVGRNVCSRQSLPLWCLLKLAISDM